MMLREPNDPLNQSRGIMGPLENATGVQNNRGRLRQRFDLIRKLGQGTYGKVQLGIDKETGQEVAIKTIKKSKIETEADLIRIRREIQIMSSVRHPNIIHIYEVFENREKMVLVMEYAAGGELYDYLNERKILQEDEARRIFRQIASAAYYCHKHKICHRDLKLENILLDEKFNAKIADFGLSNVFDEVIMLKTFCGSPLYASPEIVRGTPYSGPEVDCWSLGVLLYTLVYGAMPFDGSNFKRLVKQISHGDYFEPKKPAEASPLIRIMLTVDPKKRAYIRKVCSHPCVNQGFDDECLSIAEELATQTPVRLDLLLALANCNSAISQNQAIVDQQQAQQQKAPPVPPPPSNDQVGQPELPPPIPPPPTTNHIAEQPVAKKPKRTKVQSKSKSSPMLELIKDDEEELELPPHEGKERDEEDACDTLSEISEIQTIAEDLEGAGAVSRANTASDAAMKGKVVKKEKKVPPVCKPTVSGNAVQQIPASSQVVETQSVAPPATQSAVKKTEPESNETTKKTTAEVPPTAPVPTTEDKAPIKKKVPIKPKVPEATDKTDVTPAVPTPSTAVTEKAKKAVPSSRETTPARKEKSETPPEKETSGESGEEGRVRQKLKDRSDSVSPTRIERRNSKVISQKTAELIQNLETKVLPSLTQSNVEPPPKPPGIKKIVIPSFKVSDAKSKFESKPLRPLTTSVSRSKAAFEAKLQSQSSVEEKAAKPKGDSPPAESAKPKPAEAAKPKPAEQVPPLPTQPVSEAVQKPTTQAPPKPDVAQPSEIPTKATIAEVADGQKVVKAQPKVEASPTPTPAPKVTSVGARGPGKIQIPAALASAPEKVPTGAAGGNEVKPVLMDSGKGAPRAAVMVVKGKPSPLPEKPSSIPQAEPLSSQPPNEPTTIVVACSEPQPPTIPACTESCTSVAPPESDTEGETGKSGGTAPPPLGPAAAAKQKLLSKLPPAAVTTPSTQNGNAGATPTTPGANKEQAVKKISSVITKIVSSGSVDKGLNTEEGQKKFSTLPRAVKPEPEKIVKTEVCFPVSAPQAQVQPPHKPAPLSLTKQQPSQERIIPIQLVDEVVNSPPPTPSSTTTVMPSASPSMTSVTSRSSVTPAASRAERLNSLGSLYSRQNSSETESCSVATAPPKLEALRKCPREFLIPIKMEDSGQTVTPREDLTSGGSTADASQIGEDDFRVDSRLRSGRFARPKRYSSLLSDSSFEEEPNAATTAASVRRASTATTGAAPTGTHSRSRSQGDEPTTPGGTFKRYRNRRHATAAPDMPLDRSDSFSSAEEDEEDAFQVLTAESLFSNLLDRVRNLTRRINRDDPLMAPNWSTDPATFGLWGNSPLREFMSTSRAPSETRSFASSGPGSYRREPSITMSNSAAAPGGAWRHSLSRDLSGDSDSGHSASINTANGQSRSQMSRLSSELYDTASARSLPLSTRRSPSYLSHRSVENDLMNPYGPTRTYTRTLSHSGGDYHPSPGTSSPSSSAALSRTLPLRRSLKTFDRGSQSILPEYDGTPLSSSSGVGGMGSMNRHSLLDADKYDSTSSFLTRLRSASRDRHSQLPERESSVSRRTSYTHNQSSGKANGWVGGQDAVSNLMSSSSSFSASSTTSSHPTTIGENSFLGSPMSTGVSLDSESSILSPNSSFSFPIEHAGSPSRLLSVQEKMNNYSQYYQSLTQSPFRRLPLASPSQIHANSSSPPTPSSFGVGLSELKNNITQPPSSILSRPTSFRPGQNGSSVILPLKVESGPLEVGVASSTSDDGSATPYIQSPVSNTVSSVTSASISPPQIHSPVNKLELSPKFAEEVKAAAAKPPVSSSTATSIPRWPSVSVRQHRTLSISSFPDGPRASSVSRVMSPPPVQSEKQTIPQHLVNGSGTESNLASSVAASVQKRRDARATSVERITRLLERKSMPRELNSLTTNITNGSSSEISKKKTEDIAAIEDTVLVNGESEKPKETSKKPKFLQSLEKKWEKLTHSGSGTATNKAEHYVSPIKLVEAPTVSQGDPSTPASPEPHQAGGTSEESSTHEDKINESVLLRRALSPEKKTKTTSSRLGSGGTVGFMLGKFKKMEGTPSLNSSMSKIPTGRPPVGAASIGNNSLSSRLGRRVALPYTGTTSDSVLTLTAAAKETGRGSTEEEGGLIKSAAVISQQKRRFQPRIEVKKDIPSTQEGPTSAMIPESTLAQPQQLPHPPQIQIHEDNNEARSDSGCLPNMDLSSLSPISVSEDGTSGNPPAKSDSGNLTDDAESVSDRILRKSFYNRFNAQSSGIDRNKRAHSVTPGSSRRAMGTTTPNNLRVNTGGVSNGLGGPKSPGSGPHPARRSVSPAASTIASLDSKDSSGSDQGSSQNRSPSPYWSGLNKYNPNPLFKELMIGEDFRSNEVGKKTEYSRRITSKLSKLLREIESDLNSCQLSKTGSDDGDAAGLLLGGDGGGSGGNRTLIPNRVMTNHQQTNSTSGTNHSSTPNGNSVQ